jgi:DNA-binding transcriptional MerR regulator
VRIGELAARAGVSTRSLRYYEEQGLLGPERTPGGHREFDEDSVARVQLVQLLFSAGLASRAVVDFLPFLDTGAATQEMADRLAAEQERVAGELAELARVQARLAELSRVAEDSLAGVPAAQCIAACRGVVA